MLKYNLDGKFFIIVRNMYEQAKSCVKLNGNCSLFFFFHLSYYVGQKYGALKIVTLCISFQVL